jgi:hypothetical protein
MRRCRLLVLVVSLAGALASFSSARDGRGESLTPEEVARRIRQMKALAPQDWTKIPWVGSLVDARRLAAQERCPIFLFTFEGNLATGRC